ncbi:MAG: BREX-1 system adenine-specific DNA-methyltransferase PglX [Epulopiscium sp.]|nr:BREX-1 system adenine-specific DNA-methyltransferase PglX [Candidatus Epulonipiscium sp.]
MDKTILRNFAIDARKKLMQEIKNKGAMIGITEKGIQDPLPESTSDMLVFDIQAIEPYKIYGKEVKQYEELIKELNKRKESGDYATAYNSLIEEVAYTWFNRLIAIRFMEVNDYLPDKMRVLSSGREGVNEPEFVTHYEDTSLKFTDEELEQLSSWKIDGRAIAMEKMFHFLFIKQCNALNKNLPQLFEETDDYAELLLTISYIDEDGVLYKLVHDIPEEYFDIESENGSGQVEIIGWMYQYYNTEPKANVDIEVKKGKTVSKEKIPAKTQLFTPDWIVRYMVENSLGRLWIEKLLSSGDVRSEKEIAEEFNWKYYIPEAEQSLEVKEQLIEIRKDRKNTQLEDIRFIDPAMGSFHIGVYAFEVFMQLYESQGYTAREATKLIIEKNLYGLDIDKRAYQLSYFACLMKGRQYNRRILNEEINCNLHAIPESNKINQSHLDYLGNHISDKKAWDQAKEEIVEILHIFKDAKEYGSILEVSHNYDFASLKEFILSGKPKTQISLDSVGLEYTQEKILEILDIAEVLAQKYDAVVTNPPYLTSRDMNPKLKKYVNKKYPESKADLFAVFIEKSHDMLKGNGISSLVTMESWMFLSSYEKFRDKLLRNNMIVQLMHMNNMVMRIAFGTAVTIFKKGYIDQYLGTYHMVKYEDLSNDDKPTIFPKKDNRYSITAQDNFEKIPGMPIAYWASESVLKCFEYNLIGGIYDVKQGMTTAANGRFLRLWYEISNLKTGYGCKNLIDAKESKKKWFPYNKGGSYRKWYGNNEYVVNYENDGCEMKEFTSKLPQGTWVRLKSREFYFKKSITWTFISSSKFGVRYSPTGFIFDVAGSSMFPEKDIYYILGFLSTKIAFEFLQIVNPTLNYQIKDVKSLPIIIIDGRKEEINLLSKENIDLSKTDWDAFETSWDFKIHPLLKKEFNFMYSDLDTRLPSITIESTYNRWKNVANNNFNQLKANEEELNRIFIKTYGLEDELTPEVSDRDITITKIFDTKDEIYDDIKGNRYILTKEDVIKSFISYGVGCMFGRYSLDVEGLAYAGGEWDDNKYSSFMPVKDNIILITDEEYFEDDIVNRFIEFVKVSYGEEVLDENLTFIAGALGGRGTPKEIIRNYFLKDFFNDHVRTYQKRPIYWLYDSGRDNGFKALVYMHRYNEDTTGKVRIDYLHAMQKAYERVVDHLKYDIAENKSPREVAQSERRLTKITKQLKECKDYDEKIAHLALARIPIDLDDGVKDNYDKIQRDEKGNTLQILAKIR